MAYRSADGRTITIACVVVPRVELVAHQGCPPTADILNLLQGVVPDHPASGVSGVGGDYDSRAPGNFLRNLVRVDMIPVLLRQGDRDRGKLWALIEPSDSPLGRKKHRTYVFEQGEHFIVR